MKRSVRLTGLIPIFAALVVLTGILAGCRPVTEPVDTNKTESTSETLSADSQNTDAQNKDEAEPWNKEGAKKPSEYTWAEFEALSGANQIKFQNWFEDIDAFDAWMKNAQSTDEGCPWDEKGAKQPSEYTWAEFEALSGAHQIAFQNWFKSFDEFDEWMKNANP